MYLNLIKTGWVFFTEGIGYSFHKDLQKMIINVGRRLSSINLVYVKFLQAVAADDCIEDEALKAELSGYTDNVPYTESDVPAGFLKTLQENGIFLKQSVPISAGLIALVYKGCDKDGKVYAIKVRRSGVRAKMIRSVREIEAMIRYASRYRTIRAMKLAQKFADNRDTLFEQLDFESEVANIQLFREKYRHVSYMVIPEVYPEFTEKNSDIIVMDFVEGVKLDDVVEADRAQYCELMAKYGMKSVFFDGVFHGDLHKGNLLFLKGKENADDEEEKLRIALLDFGIVYKITREEQNHFYNFMVKFCGKEYDAAVAYLYEHITEPAEARAAVSDEEKTKMLAAITSIFEEIMEVKKRASSKDIYNINAMLGKNGLEISKFFSQIQLAFIINETLCNQLSLEEPFIDIYGKQLLAME